MPEYSSENSAGRSSFKARPNFRNSRVQVHRRRTRDAKRFRKIKRITSDPFAWSETPSGTNFNAFARSLVSSGRSAPRANVTPRFDRNAFATTFEEIFSKFLWRGLDLARQHLRDALSPSAWRRRPARQQPSELALVTARLQTGLGPPRIATGLQSSLVQRGSKDSFALKQAGSGNGDGVL